MNESSGRYGFHACVRVSAPYARVRIASTAANATISRTPPRRNAIHSAVPIASTMQRDCRHLHRPRRRAEQPVDRPQHPEAHRTGMASLAAERADAADEADQRRMAGPDVADAQLGHRQVEDRIPALLRQHCERDDQRQREQREEPGADQQRSRARAGRQPKASPPCRNGGGGLGLEGVVVTLDGLGGVPHRRAGSAVRVHEGRSIRSGLVSTPAARACDRSAASSQSRLSTRRSPGRTGDWWCERFADSSS